MMAIEKIIGITCVSIGITQMNGLIGRRDRIAATVSAVTIRNASCPIHKLETE